MAKILIIDDEKALREAIAQILHSEGHEVLEAADGEQGLKLLQNSATHLDLVFLDLKMPKTQGMTVLKQLEQKRFELPVIVMTAYGTSRTAIEAMQLGAYDYLTKPFDLDELVNLTTKALAHHQEPLYQVGESTLQTGQEELLGRSQPMQSVFKLIGRLAPTDTIVLITGESGTGKELVASTLHTASPRSKAPLVKVNCAALPEHLLEAELFGHEKGAFTGANHLRLGRFEQANSGTIFLDEIGELSLVIQGKLLRVLQDCSFERLGSNQTHTVNVRIIAATNRNLEQMVQQNQFREDLFYRLNVVRLELPPLRDRPEDLEQLTQHFLSTTALRRGFKRLALAESAMKRLRNYTFPGNVRELQNTLERAAILSGGRTILPEHLVFSQKDEI
ncbi:two-component system response regulator [Nostoc sp. 'Peltigera membranacea cyanobiont' 213]|uniref:sigma-54-dependent transcriptional regulator n=1 Tax=Nostoc sp. 'Peltigera membranacea cyanobiont' 213 TaxID=2014530 RepID=UPI000B9587B7|nr:sigma-54 dependent transcriptional regulator [Nostoc sp. 'Peltigera membranacea cyanobiont' 213]OYD97306.1 two-component system response regulator [Nostoc sp. 'Peltigera membranacea cyanobiont' 213]